MTSAISSKPWSDYKEADYTVQQWHKACLIHTHTGAPTNKIQCKLPVYTPDGTLNSNGVHAAAAALAGARTTLMASAAAKTSAAKQLLTLYKKLDEQPPPSLLKLQHSAIDDEDEETLEHHGVKGMKWGVRNDRGHAGKQASTRKIARLDKRFEKQGAGYNNFIATYNRAARLSNKNDVDRINNKPEYKDKDFTKSSPLRDKYYEEHVQAFNNNLRKAAAELGTNASGTRKVEAIINADGDWNLRVVDVQHADGDYIDALDGVTVSVFYDGKGHISRIEMPSAQQSDLSNVSVDEFLEHVGVKGMKWGVRKRRSSAHIEEPGDAPDHTRARQLHATAKTHGTRKLTNKDLEDLNKRLNLEQNYTKLTTAGTDGNKAVKTGTKWIREVANNVGKQVAAEILKGHVLGFAKDKGITAAK